MSDRRRFVRVCGRLWENMQFEPEPGWETETVHRRPTPDEAYQLVLRDGQGRVLVSVSPGFERQGCRAAAESMRYDRLLGYVPMHPDAATLELGRDDRVIYRATLASAPPTVRISGLEMSADETVRVVWEAEHDRPLTFEVAFVDGRGRAFPVARRLEHTSLDVDTAPFPGGGGCRVGILATDGLRSAHVLSEPFAVPPKPPSLGIIRPADGETIEPDQPMTLSGYALDAGGEALPIEAYRWLVDGQEVARAARLALGPALAPGEHRVTLVLDGYDATVEASVRVARRPWEPDEAAAHDGDAAR
jgi:hypothetical protein